MSARASHAALMTAAALLTSLAPAGATATPLNDTTILYCIDAGGVRIDCEGTGQDGEFGRDVTRPKNGDGRAGFSFTKVCNNGDNAGEGNCPRKIKQGNEPTDWGCTRDEVTGLLWENKDNSGYREGRRTYTYYSPEYDPHGKYGGPYDATGFLNAVNEAGLCSAHDWRLPTPTELMGLVDMAILVTPAIDTRFFPNTQLNLYWAAGTVLGTSMDLETAWGTDFYVGQGDISHQLRSSQRPVRLVRGDGGHVGKRYAISPDEQEVTDRWTHLTWRRCLEGQTFNGLRCSGSKLMLNWLDTLAHARQQAHDTGVAWRLPNLKELASLLDHDRLPHVNVKAFPGAGHDLLWSSSPTPAGPPTPRCATFEEGTTFDCSQGSGGLGSRLVRDRD